MVLGEHASVWMNAVIRGDVHSIRVGAHSNVQDCAVLHGMRYLYRVIVGEYVTIGHNATVHGCVVEDCCLIGIGAVILNNAHIGEGSIIAAGTVIPENMKIPPQQKCYSLNEGNRLTLPEGYQRYLHWAQENGYSSRYVGAMVADVHRILIQGGVFMYPPTKKAPKGKLRLMYEANPMAMLVEQAGGKALAGPGERILDVPPTQIHQRTCVILGSRDEVDLVTNHLQ